MPFRAAFSHPRRRSPRPPVPRHDGFSPQQQRCFLEMLAATASVTQAAAAAGVSRTTAYKHRHDPRAVDFRDGWAAALARAMGVLVDAAIERAATGVEEAVFHAGEQVGTRVRHDHRLLRFLVDNRACFAPTEVHVARGGATAVREGLPPATLAAHLDRIDPPARRARDRVVAASTSSTSHAGAEGTGAAIPARATDPAG